jgi:20S proteasome subunit alpha 5
MTLPEAQKLALKVLKQVMEEKLDESNVQLAQVTKVEEGGKSGGFRILKESELKNIIESVWGTGEIGGDAEMK